MEQEEKVSETPRGEAEMSMVAAKTASPAKGQLSLESMFGWGSGASQTAEALVEKPMNTQLEVKQEVQAQNMQLGGQVSGRLRHWKQMRPYGAAPGKIKNLTGQQKVYAIEMVDASMQAGVSKNKSMEKTAGHMKISLSQMKRLMTTEEREYWLTWAKQEDRRGQEREGTVRRRG